MGNCYSHQQPPSPLPPVPRRETTEDFKSTRINIQIDTRTDENKILDKEQGYPNPKPSDYSKDNLHIKHHWFKDDQFNNASDDADLFKTEIGVDDDDIDLDTLSDEFNDDVKPKSVRPSAIVKPALSFDDIDNHAKKAGPHLLYSFQELTQYLTLPLHAEKYKKIKTARAIVVWLSQQKLEGVSYGLKSIDTPRGLLQYLKEERMTYTTCYTILCRKAGLQCVVIKGNVKASSYEPGDAFVPQSSWNAVYVECGWQIVHSFWVCRALFGHSLGGWVKIEKDGATMTQKESACFGIERTAFTERYFMPNPVEFIYECCASEKEWQLVPPQSVVSSLIEFVEKAYLFPPFFGVGFQLISAPKCVLHSADGFCKVELKANPANAHMLVLRYELFMKESNDDQSYSSFGKDESMSRMVFNSRAGETFIFELRFPRRGIYKLVIYGGPFKSPVLRLCEFKLVCEKEMTGHNLLPLECDYIGWGPGPVSVEAGLLMPSKPSGLIPISDKEKKTEIKFQLRDIGQKYTAVVHGEVDGRRKQVDCVGITKVKQLHQLVISVTIPDKGEYGLSIHDMSAKSHGKHGRNVCNYLISTYAYRPDHANVKNAKQRLRENMSTNVEARQWKQHIVDIQTCIERCKKERVPDTDDEIISANAMVWFLTCKDKLRDCVLRRNLHVVRKTLAVISLYKNQAALTKEIKVVKELEEDLIALRGFARQVPKLEEANKELIALKHAPVEVQNTFTALLVLLGENESNLSKWSDIQLRMKVSANTCDTSVLGKLRRIQDISSDRREKALLILHRYKEEQVRKVNSDAHSYYLWIENVINVHEDK